MNTPKYNPVPRLKQYLARLPYLRRAAVNLPAEVARFEAALAALPADERRALELFYFDRLGYVAIGFRLNYSERTCKRLVKRALEHLALALYGER